MACVLVVVVFIVFDVMVKMGWVYRGLPQNLGVHGEGVKLNCFDVEVRECFWGSGMLCMLGANPCGM